MIRKKMLPEQEEFWVSRESIRAGRGKSFYDRLADDLDKEGFGDFVRELCAPYYHAEAGGRPPIDPEVYFKMLMVGYFEKLPSERGIASRCEDSLSVRRFLRYDVTEATPDHSSLSVIRHRLPAEVYAEVFTFSLRPLRRAGLLPGKKIGIDSTTMEANASLEKLERREDGKSYGAYVAELAAAEGIDPEDKAAVAEFDRKRKGKKTSNEEWVSPNDPDASIGPRKDGAWDMIHKVENAVDLDSGAILSCEIQSAAKADSTDMAAHIETAADMVDHVADQVDEPTRIATDQDAEPDDEETGEDKEDAASEKRYGVGDKGYHKNAELAEMVAAGMEPVIAEPSGRAPSKSNREQAKAFEINRANRKTDLGRELMRARAEKVERSFQHQLDHGGARRTTLTGRENIGKRLLISAFTFNLAIYGRNVHGFGTLKQYRAGNRWIDALFALVRRVLRRFTPFGKPLKRNCDRSPIRGIFPSNAARPSYASEFPKGAVI
jgi:transposase